MTSSHPEYNIFEGAVDFSSSDSPSSSDESFGEISWKPDGVDNFIDTSDQGFTQTEWSDINTMDVLDEDKIDVWRWQRRVLSSRTGITRLDVLDELINERIRCTGSLMKKVNHLSKLVDEARRDGPKQVLSEWMSQLGDSGRTLEEIAEECATYRAALYDDESEDSVQVGPIIADHIKSGKPFTSKAVSGSLLTLHEDVYGGAYGAGGDPSMRSFKSLKNGACKCSDYNAEE